MAESDQNYRNEMIARFLKYREVNFPEDAMDTEAGTGQVFKIEHGACNLFGPELADLLPPRDWHRWFRSMASSQALTVSVIGTMAQRGDLGMLSGLICDDASTLLPTDTDLRLDSFEHTPTWLEKGKRKSQIDAYISGPDIRLAIECKLMESDVGRCHMSKDGEPQPVFGDLAGYDFCPRVKFNGARYWDYWPMLSGLPLPQECSNACILHRTYQLARNVMAAAMDPDLVRSGGRGLSLLLYDERNPSFWGTDDACSSPQGVGVGAKSFATLKEALDDPDSLRSASWQSLTGLLWAAGGYENLIEFLKDKYGILPEKQMYTEDDIIDGIIYPDKNPINADWIKIVHWENILSEMSSVDELLEYLPDEGFTPEEFRSLHYFDYLMERHPWMQWL